MRAYSIYQIKEEHLKFILGRERKLLEMMTDIDHAQQSSLKELSYICEPMLLEELHPFIIAAFEKQYPIINSDCERLTFIHPIKGKIMMELTSNVLQVHCEGSRMLDLDLFQSLVKLSERFIAFNKKDMECGWLKPMKHLSH